MKAKEKAYKMQWINKYGDIIATKVYHFYHIKEARKHAESLFAECMMNDVVKIKASRE